jgi:hypothetical protein
MVNAMIEAEGERQMLKGMVVLTIAAVLSGPAMAAPATSSARSFEECHQLAVSRGVHPRKRPDRYTALKGAGQKTTNPQGLIARCMAGKLS